MTDELNAMPKLIDVSYRRSHHRQAQYFPKYTRLPKSTVTIFGERQVLGKFLLKTETREPLSFSTDSEACGQPLSETSAQLQYRALLYR